jgi:hypothetical protein
MSQLTSALLQTPLEIRHEIYSYILPPKIHVHLSDGKLETGLEGVGLWS